MNIHIVYSIIALIAACACGFITIPVVLDFCKKNGIYDIPNQRKIHKNAVPRLGGIVFLPSVLIGCLIAFLFARIEGTTTVTLSLWTIYFLFGVTAIYIIGIIDDLFYLNAVVKLVVQLIAASMLPLAGLWMNNLYGLFGIEAIPYYIGIPLTIFVLVFVDNAINLIDGIDGLASGLAFLILASFAYLYHELHAHLFSIISTSLAGATLAFFFFNMYGKVGRLKTFMGDSGSLFLGYVIAYLAIKYQMEQEPLGFSYREESLLISFTLVFLPCIDVIRVGLWRKFRGRSMFEADKTHIHHRIMQMGLDMHQTLAVIITLSSSSSASSTTASMSEVSSQPTS